MHGVVEDKSRCDMGLLHPPGLLFIRHTGHFIKGTCILLKITKESEFLDLECFMIEEFSAT